MHVEAIPERLSQITTLQLTKGSHESLEAGMCVMEAVAFVAGEPWSDHPQCASPLIAAFLRRWNDDLDDAGRQMLKPFIGKLVGTKSTNAVENQRAWMMTDWVVRYYTPAWLDLAGCSDQAAALRSLPAIVDTKSCTAAQPEVDGACKHADAARAAAWAAAGTAAWDATGAAAWAATGDAAWVTAFAAARAVAGAVAGAVAKTKLQPTVVSLQASALDLMDRMIDLRALAIGLDKFNR